jgi:proline iminopeptidase
VLLAFVAFILTSCDAQQSGFATSTDGTLIYYRVYGSGAPLLIINGGPGMNSDGFEQLAIHLSKNNQTIIYDQRGTGKSIVANPDSNSITMQLMVDDMESIRSQLHFKTWSILGHSFGGMLACYYATKHPERIEKMILSSSGGVDLQLLLYLRSSLALKLTAADQDSVTYWSKVIANGDTSHSAELARARFLAKAYVVDKKFIPVIAERLTQGNPTINKLLWENMQKINFDCAPGLKTFDKPVLIIQGKQDIIKASTAKKAHALIKNSKMVFMDHCAHYGWLDNEAVYYREVNNILAN